MTTKGTPRTARTTTTKKNRKMAKTCRLLPLACLALLPSHCSAYIVQSPDTSKIAKDNSNIFPIKAVENDTTEIGTLTVPVIGCGTIAWSSNSFTELENEELEKLVEVACDSNAAFFDTAERYGSHIKTAFGFGYGETEKLTGKLIRRAMAAAEKEPVVKPVVATKFTPVPWRTTVESVVEACDKSRRNLGVDQIDLYQIHMPDIVKPLRFLGQDKPIDSVYWDGVAECYHRGLAKNIGVCNYGPTLVEQCQEALAKRGVPLASNQIGYSLLGRHNGAQETVDKCNELGVQVLAYYPFAMGLLTGKYSRSNSSNTQKEDNNSLLSFKRSSLELKDLKNYAIDPLLSTMETIASNRGKTVAQVALNYIICKGAIPIPGARTMEQLKDNVGAMGWRLSDTEVAMLELEADKLGFGFDGAGFKRTSEKFVGYGVEKFQLN